MLLETLFFFICLFPSGRSGGYIAGLWDNDRILEFIFESCGNVVLRILKRRAGSVSGKKRQQRGECLWLVF